MEKKRRCSSAVEGKVMRERRWKLGGYSESRRGKGRL